MAKQSKKRKKNLTHNVQSPQRYDTGKQHLSRRDGLSIARRRYTRRRLHRYTKQSLIRRTEKKILRDRRSLVNRHQFLTQLGREAKITSEPNRRSHFNEWGRRYFVDPRSVPICERRKTRREIIFARNKSGKGVHRKKPTYNETSEIVCRRR